MRVDERTATLTGKRTPEEILNYALQNASRDDTGAANRSELVAIISRYMPYDSEAEQRRKGAIAFLRRFEQRGTTRPSGIIEISGRVPHPYEPGKLIKHGEFNELVIEQASARVRAKRDDLRRKYDNFKEVEEAYLADKIETDLFEGWATEQTDKGRPPREIIFDNFVREMGYWKEQPVAWVMPDDDE